MEFEEKLKQYIEEFEQFLPTVMPIENEYYPVLARSMNYATQGGGKRIRPVIVLAVADMLCGQYRGALNFAAALEMIHSYSLVHDDLPCMDNDDYRRGKESTHKKFGEANGLLCGDALLTYAFYVCVTGDEDDSTKVKAVSLLSKYAGIDGMIGGQEIDLRGSDNCLSENELFKMDVLKTSALLSCACSLGCVYAKKTELLDIFHEYGKNVGIAFQIIDDILDFYEGENSSDIVENKTTYVSLYTLDGAYEKAKLYTDNALKCLEEIEKKGYDISFLVSLTKMLLDRRK